MIDMWFFTLVLIISYSSIFHYYILLLIRNTITISTFGKKTQDRREKRPSHLLLLLSCKINIDPPGRHTFGSLKHAGQLEGTTIVRRP